MSEYYEGRKKRSERTSSKRLPVPFLWDLNCNIPQFCYWAGKDDRENTRIFTFDLPFKLEDWKCFLLLYSNSLGYQSC